DGHRHHRARRRRARQRLPLRAVRPRRRARHHPSRRLPRLPRPAPLSALERRSVSLLGVPLGPPCLRSRHRVLPFGTGGSPPTRFRNAAPFHSSVFHSGHPACARDIAYSHSGRAAHQRRDSETPLRFTPRRSTRAALPALETLRTPILDGRLTTNEIPSGALRAFGAIRVALSTACRVDRWPPPSHRALDRNV